MSLLQTNNAGPKLFVLTELDCILRQKVIRKKCLTIPAAGQLQTCTCGGCQRCHVGH